MLVRNKAYIEKITKIYEVNWKKLGGENVYKDYKIDFCL